MKVSEYLAGLVVGVPVPQGAPVLQVKELKPFSASPDDRRQVLTVDLFVEHGGLELED